MVNPTYRQLLEEVADYDRVQIPDNVRFPIKSPYQKLLGQIVREVDGYHRTKDNDQLKRSLELSLSLLNQMAEDIVRTRLANEHEKRLLKSKMSSLVAIKKGGGVTDENL
jgi:hypothetical protein